MRRVILCFTIIVILLLLAVSFSFWKERVSPEKKIKTTYLVATIRAEFAELIWLDQRGAPFRSFEAAIDSLGKDNVVFATNAGIFDPEFRPCGLFIENYKELVPVNLGSGTGNFYLKPNGALLVENSVPRILESNQVKNDGGIRIATQSGPLLLSNGAINKEFKPESQNLAIRSGVGVTKGNVICFVLTESPINFYNFALIFKDLGCQDALYLDGNISKFYAPSIGLNQLKGEFAGIFVIKKNAHGFHVKRVQND